LRGYPIATLVRKSLCRALRIARSQTGRSKVVKFAGSYHGTYDGILADNDDQGSYPATSGITMGSIQDTVVLNYGDPKALEVIEQLGSELAAVLVEPVQRRNPALQPKAFLQQLRQLTTASGTALIFDEVITGFRLQPGGAQAFLILRPIWWFTARSSAAVCLSALLSANAPL
jgi:iturin family lipopeptide synthetase A